MVIISAGRWKTNFLIRRVVSNSTVHLFKTDARRRACGFAADAPTSTSTPRRRLAPTPLDAVLLVCARFWSCLGFRSAGRWKSNFLIRRVVVPPFFGDTQMQLIQEASKPLEGFGAAQFAPRPSKQDLGASWPKWFLETSKRLFTVSIN